MKIRTATQDDMPAVHELIRELAIFEKEPDAVVISVDDLVRDGFGDDPLFYVFVCEIDDKIQGMAFYYCRYSTWKGKTIHLEDLIVRQEMRGKGIGLALYTEILKEAKKQRVRRVEWNVLDWNIDAIRFYERSGAKILDDWKVVQISEADVDEFLKNG